jgi:hypothetical protein
LSYPTSDISIIYSLKGIRDWRLGIRTVKGIGVVVIKQKDYGIRALTPNII